MVPPPSILPSVIFVFVRSDAHDVATPTCSAQEFFLAEHRFSFEASSRPQLTK